MYFWLRVLDLNQRPQGYEPCELPTALTRVILFVKYICYVFNSYRLTIAMWYITGVFFLSSHTETY